MNDNLIDMKDVQLGYDNVPVVHIESLSLARGRCLGIFGPNGSGKTTLVRGITGLLQPLSGVVATPRVQELRFGFLSQYRGVDKSWPMSGLDAAALSASARSAFGRISKLVRLKIETMADRLEMRALLDRSFADLSGGQQQRLLLAGALAGEPDVLVLDEPTDGLDVRSRDNLLKLLKELQAERLCIALISHDVEDLLTVANDVAWLHPASSAGEPSTVESVSPEDLADRLLNVRRGVH